MKIAIIGPQNSGKTQLISQFLAKWPMYNLAAENDYRTRDDLNLNREGTVESQTIIRDCLVDQILQADGEFCLFDRCPIDNFVYTLYLHNKHPDQFDAEFVKQTRDIVAASMQSLDVIFCTRYNPLYNNTREEKSSRDTDAEYITDIDNLFGAIVLDNQDRTGFLSPPRDAPPIIELIGPPEGYIAQIADYISDAGTPIESNINFMDEVQKLASQLQTPNKSIIMP